jgi:lysozyme
MSPRTLLAIRLGALVSVVMVLVVGIVVLGRRASPNPSTPLVLLPGVDVSSHDAPESWTAPARSGLRFVIARASEGDSRRDQRYASIKREAKASGLAFTAFHYARPDRARGDAVREANLFTDAADLGPGDLAPVLDLEESGGLGADRLRAWVKAWLEEVEATLGAKPLIYTNLDFWRTHMDDTVSFAEAGYGLFVASWGGSTPSLPAADWAGRGWTIWQTSECGAVRGIPGCIRTDLFNGGDLEPVTIG